MGLLVKCYIVLCRTFDVVKEVIDFFNEENSGVIWQNATGAINYNGIKNDLIEKKPKQASIAEHLNKSILETFGLKEAQLLLENIKFKDDSLNLKSFII